MLLEIIYSKKILDEFRRDVSKALRAATNEAAKETAKSVKLEMSGYKCTTLDEILDGGAFNANKRMPNPHKCWSCGAVIEYEWLNKLEDDLGCPVCESINVTRLDMPT